MGSARKETVVVEVAIAFIYFNLVARLNSCSRTPGKKLVRAAVMKIFTLHFTDPSLIFVKNLEMSQQEHQTGYGNSIQ